MIFEATSSGININDTDSRSHPNWSILMLINLNVIELQKELKPGKRTFMRHMCYIQRQIIMISHYVVRIPFFQGPITGVYKNTRSKGFFAQSSFYALMIV